MSLLPNFSKTSIQEHIFFPALRASQTVYISSIQHRACRHLHLYPILYCTANTTTLHMLYTTHSFCEQYPFNILHPLPLPTPGTSDNSLPLKVATLISHLYTYSLATLLLHTLPYSLPSLRNFSSNLVVLYWPLVLPVLVYIKTSKCFYSKL